MSASRLGKNPWDRQEKESSPAYGAFTTYLELGEKRTYVKVAEKERKSDSLIRRWSKRWNWKERSVAYDNEIRRQALEAAREDLSKMHRRQIATAMLLQKKALEALDKIDIESLDPRDILKYFTEGAKIEAEIRDVSMPQGTQGNPLGAGLADTILNAYRGRMDKEGDVDG